MKQEVIAEAISAEPILYERGAVRTQLTDFNAWQYRSMIWKYGKAEATERFWWLWHKERSL